jgi:hypothetical protein
VEHQNYGGLEADVVHLGIFINLGKLEEMQTIGECHDRCYWEMEAIVKIQPGVGVFLTRDT